MGGNIISEVRPDLGTPARTKSAHNATNLGTKSHASSGECAGRKTCSD